VGSFFISATTLAPSLSSDGVDRLQVVQETGVDARLHHGRHLAAVQGAKALGPGARAVVHVPVEGFGQLQALRRLQAQAVDVAEHQQAGQLLAALDDAELGGLLDRVDGVGAGVGQADDLGLGALRLQQEGREVGRAQRHLDAAQHLAAGRLDDLRGVFFEGVAEGVVGGQEEPAVAPAFTTALPVPCASIQVS
jgi:hypothetical protein